jgi:hypothetical protein
MNQSLGRVFFLYTTKNLHFDIVDAQLLELNEVWIESDVSHEHMYNVYINIRGTLKKQIGLKISLKYFKSTKMPLTPCRKCLACT